ncbi:C-C chemokine receptor type 1 [Colossoma macropomum]|uniref:C-C chemokine receptor type 1 n=1 Tax=Colossoma macropomum TaxID=42526 RepID=UPI00186440F8|nr:C-C chemokine receptor type 1 [Colossoma macropomum]
MDVFHPLSVNESYDNNYEEYYNLEASVDYGPCKKHQAREFSQSFLPVFYSLTCVLSIITNISLIITFIRFKSLRRALPLNMKYVDMACMLLSSARRKRALCAFLWLLSLLATAPHLYFVEAHEFQGQKICTNHFLHKHGWRIYMRFQMIVLGFCIPLLVLVFSTVLIVRTVARTTLLKRSRTLTLVTGFTVLFFVLWFPYSLVIFLHALQELHVISECTTSLHLDLAVVGTECIAFMHVYLNPIAYVLLNKRIWRKIRGRCLAPRENLLGPSESTGSETTQDSAVELKAFGMYLGSESEGSNAERQGHFLPHVT